MYQLVLLHPQSRFVRFAFSAMMHSPDSCTCSTRQFRQWFRDIEQRGQDIHIIACTGKLPRAHAAILFACVVTALSSVFAATFPHIFTIEQLTAMVGEVSLPQHDYVIQKTTRRVRRVAWRFASVFAGAATLRGKFPARDVRALTRSMRDVFARMQREVAWLWKGDEILAKALRRRCGLSRNDSRSWLVDHNANFE